VTRKIITLEFIIPTVSAVALAIILSVGGVYLTEMCRGPIEPVELITSPATDPHIAPKTDRAYGRPASVLGSNPAYTTPGSSMLIVLFRDTRSLSVGFRPRRYPILGGAAE
jgi:hypothetical protein